MDTTEHYWGRGWGRVGHVLIVSAGPGRQHGIHGPKFHSGRDCGRLSLDLCVLSVCRSRVLSHSLVSGWFLIG